MRPSNRYLQRSVVQLTLIAAACIAAFPLLWIALASFKTEVAASAPASQAFSFTPTLINYTSLFQSSTFRADGVTTIVTTTATTMGCITIGTVAGYSFARLWVPGRRLIVTMLVCVQVVPTIVLLIPLYRMVSSLGLYDTWISIIVVQIGLYTPFVTWLMVAFVRAIPVEVEEAAMVDGANRLQLFRYVLVPMLIPGLVAAAILTSISAWNSFMVPVILGQSTAQTLTTFTASFITTDKLVWAQMCAAAVVIVTPIMAITLILQRPLVRGITAGTLKG
jgi:multiple sugar transport system permease protein